MSTNDTLSFTELDRRLRGLPEALTYESLRTEALVMKAVSST